VIASTAPTRYALFGAGAPFALAGCGLVFGIDDKHYVEPSSNGSPTTVSASDSSSDASSASSSTSAGSGGSGGMMPCAEGYSTCSADPAERCATHLAADSSNCGRCGRSCGSGLCDQGRCPIVGIAPSGKYVYAITELGGDLYWGSDQLPQINKVPKTGGMPTLVTPTGPSPFGIVANAPYIYWTTFFDGVIRSYDVGTGDVRVIATQQGSADQILVDGDYLFYSVRWAPQGFVRRATISTGEVIDIATLISDPDGIALDDTYVYWTQDSPAGTSDGGLWRGKRDGSGDMGGNEHLGFSDLPASSVVVDANTIYWCPKVPPVMIALPKNGGSQSVLADLPSASTRLAIDQDAIYLADETGEIVRLAKADGALEILAESQLGVSALMLDDQQVYWVSNDAIRSTPK
jgi:hypothetical protein